MALHPHLCLEPDDRDFVRILCLDGGGMRGIISTVLLEDLERRVGAPLSEVFDLVAGTSTGGILALALAAPAEGGGPAYSSAELRGLYLEHGRTIFHRPLAHCVRTGCGLLGPKYPEEGIDEVLGRYFGARRVSQALTPVMVTSFDTETSSPYFFKSFRDAVPGFRERSGGAASPGDHLMWLAARATSAAPTYFPPLALEPLAPGEPRRALVDGGVFANNPAMCALAEAVRRFPGRKYLVVSVGTGAEQEYLPYARVRRFGLAEWALPILRVVFDGVSDAVDYQLTHVLGASNYFRFQCDSQGIPLDDASPDATRRLEEVGRALTQASAPALERLAALLTRAGRRRAGAGAA